jgi:hypothetical protein
VRGAARLAAERRLFRAIRSPGTGLDEERAGPSSYGWRCGARTDDEIGDRIRGRGLEEEYIRELMASLGFDPAEGFSNAGIEALENATMEQRRRAALRTLALAEEE